MNIPAPFSQNQKEYFDRTFTHWLNVAEGGKRGGKNVVNTLAFCTRLERHQSRIHLIAGVSTATAKINVLDCDGFGMKNFFEGRCREGEYKKRDCLYIQTPVGEKIVLISGGGKSGDEKLIKGNTYGMAYVTEANECTADFIQEVFDRTLTSPERAVFHDLNPKGDGHWYYKTVLDFHAKKQKKNSDYGFNYGHFTIADNLSVSDDNLRKTLSTYDRKSIWYARDILGLRRSPEGLIYDMFSAEKNVYSTVEAPVDMVWRSTRTIAIDYGTTNPCVFLDIYDDQETVRIDREYRWDSREEHRQKTDKEYADDLETFMGTGGCAVLVDPSAASFIAELKSRGIFVISAKNDVLDGIRKTSTLMSRGQIQIHQQCEGLRNELGAYRWDDKSSQRGEEKPVKEQDHGPDALRYYINSLPDWRVT